MNLSDFDVTEVRRFPLSIGRNGGCIAVRRSLWTSRRLKVDINGAREAASRIANTLIATVNPESVTILMLSRRLGWKICRRLRRLRFRAKLLSLRTDQRSLGGIAKYWRFLSYLRSSSPSASISIEETRRTTLTAAANPSESSRLVDRGIEADRYLNPLWPRDSAPSGEGVTSVACWFIAMRALATASICASSALSLRRTLLKSVSFRTRSWQ